MSLHLGRLTWLVALCSSFGSSWQRMNSFERPIFWSWISYNRCAIGCVMQCTLNSSYLKCDIRHSGPETWSPSVTESIDGIIWQNIWVLIIIFLSPSEKEKFWVCFWGHRIDTSLISQFPSQSGERNENKSTWPFLPHVHLNSRHMQHGENHWMDAILWQTWKHWRKVRWSCVPSSASLPTRGRRSWMLRELKYGSCQWSGKISHARQYLPQRSTLEHVSYPRWCRYQLNSSTCAHEQCRGKYIREYYYV